MTDKKSVRSLRRMAVNIRLVMSIQADSKEGLNDKDCYWRLMIQHVLTLNQQEARSLF